MPKHIKPTKEELEASLKTVQDELEEEPAVEDKEEETVAPSVEIEEPAPSREIEPSEPAPSPDYKEKFSESSREAQKIQAKNRTLNDGISKASEINDVTEDELKKEYPDWDVMSETERKLAKKNMINDKRFEIVTKATNDAKKIEKWGDDVAKFISDPKTLIDNPELEGKTDQFKSFANEATNHSVPFKILVSAFLHDLSVNAKPKSKGKMFETGSGGANEKPRTSDKLTMDEARNLMRTDYKKFKDLLIKGKIIMDIT